MGRLRDWWVGLPWEELEYRIIRRPYGHDEWEYYVQYFRRGKWRTTQLGCISGGSFDHAFWSEKSAREEIAEFKRGHGMEIVGR
jgi:hypothetical protein